MTEQRADKRDEELEQELKLRVNAWLVPILIGVVIATQLLAPYRGWRILIVGLGGAFLLSWLWSRSLVHNLDLTRQMRFGQTLFSFPVQRFVDVRRHEAPAR